MTRDIAYAVREFRRAPLAALTTVGTVGLGLGLVTVVFTFYNALFLRADEVQTPAELFEVRRPPEPGSRTWVPFTRSDYEALRRDTTVFTDSVAMLRHVGTRIDGRAVSCTLVTGNFFQVLGATASRGRALRPDDDGRSAGRPVIVLSHRGWTKLFEGDPAAIGRTLLVNGLPLEVVGVMPPGLRGLSVAPPDYWAPLALLGQFRQALAGKEDEVALEVVGRLKPNLTAETAAAGLTVWAAGNPDLKEVAGRPKSIRLIPSQGTASPDALQGLRTFTPLFFAFGLILLIACTNVANLLLARGISRQREIGIRLSLGASRRRIIRQLITESALLALAAAACGFAISRLALVAAVGLAMTTVPPEFAELIGLAAIAADWRVLVFLLSGGMISTAFFGLVPAIQATRLELVRTMRGEITRDARPDRARSALIAVQVSASALLLICAVVFLRSAFAAATADPGLRTADTVLLEIANEPRRAAMLEAVRADPSVAAVAASWPHGVGGMLAGATTSTKSPVEYKFVSPEYFSLLGIDVLKGRGFTQAERTPEAGVAVVSETTARKLWPDREAIGQAVQLDAYQPRGALKPDAQDAVPQLPFRAFTVVGVVRDVRIGLGIFEMADAGVYLPISAESAGTSLTLRVREDPDRVRQAIIGRLAKVDPAMGAVTTLRALAGRGIYVLRIAFWVTAVLGGLALVLTASGLFSVLSYMVEQRTQEIGVRMALGATARKVVELVLSQSLLPVGFGLAAGAALAAAGATVLITRSAAAPVADAVHVLDPLAYAVSIVLILAACILAALLPALRAARIDPMITLRRE